MALPKYNIPNDLKCAIQLIQEIESPTSIPATVESNNEYLPQLKNLKNYEKNGNYLETSEYHYRKDLELGLYLEEYQQREDMNKFETDGSIIKKMQDNSQGKFKLYIQDLVENNSVLRVSDSLRVCKKSNRYTEFYLKVSKICNGYIIATANTRFEEQHNDLEEYHIELIFNDYTFRCCHYALNAVTPSMISNYFFPKKTDNETPKISSQRWFNKDVLNNPEQKQAVCNIVNKSALPAPYILYGPPGTGRTSTLVEAICQIWEQSRDYILICAPSNATCDVITARLLGYISPTYLYRVYSQSQEYDKIDNNIKKCSNYNNNGTVNELKNADFNIKKIVISTTSTSLRFEKFKLPFSYIFIDEASQVSLPNALLPMCSIIHSSQNCQIVISGDHQQLRPSTRSKLAEPILGQSILNKLMKHEPYEKDEITEYDRRYITMLVHNIRSRSKIFIQDSVEHIRFLLIKFMRKLWRSFIRKLYKVQDFITKFILFGIIFIVFALSFSKLTLEDAIVLYLIIVFGYYACKLYK